MGLAVQVLAHVDVGRHHFHHAVAVAGAAGGAAAAAGGLPVLALPGTVGVVRGRRCFSGIGLGHGQCCVGILACALGRRFRSGLVELEKRVLAHRVQHFLRKVQRGQLQQPHGVLQAGRERLVLSVFDTGLERR